ncbi:phosphatidylethanolamine-binding protein [Multifurca ochricompacta]|uniref:Phosphatidylethanolamine-binding protein n=1 Tax=Multifurca ochricompacta TaxID=376703 RepID=A0AAD4MC81_9AGAM|nr:phosphatidylethanolamine-binding protein [Multifurca ochricompacta]
MFTLGRFRSLREPFIRANSTLEALSVRRILGRRNPKYPAIRPSINLERPREWNPPVALGAIPAYDEAVAYIRADATAVQSEADALRLLLENGDIPLESVKDAKAKLDVLETMAQINLPEVRWKAANGMANMSQNVYRHLIEQRWRNEGALDLLMERIYQMHVIPDVLPLLQPTVDLRVVFPEAPPKNVVLRARAKRKTAPVEPGVFLVNEQTRRPPKLYTTVFHPESRLYTLLMVDPDVPDEESQTFKTYLHWLQPNITLSATTAGLLPSASHMPYIPPHPARGTPYHRYVLLLLPHANPGAKLSLSPGPLKRDAFDVRKFVHENALRTDGGGAFMWRAVWDEESSRIWKDDIKKPEPRYGYAPKPDPYVGLKEMRKYV